ncbi:MAG: GIY-YIG nuclease family protein [Thermomicrobiales bacterium]
MCDAFVYIMANRSRTLYIGVTSDLERRVAEHKAKTSATSSTHRYNITMLIWIEQSGRITDAISREKQLKNWTRAKKVALIEAQNPAWLDLSSDWW